MQKNDKNRQISEIKSVHLEDVLSELAIMRDSLKIGIFFMNRNYIIQSNYSGYLGAMFSNPDLAGKNLLDVLSPCISSNELETIKDYFTMIFEEAHEQYILDEINPLVELEYNAPDFPKTKYFQFDFVTIKRSSGEIFALVSVYDITSKVELRKQLHEEGNRRHEEMKAVFELIQIEPHVLNEFIEDMEHEFEQINNVLSNNDLTANETLVKVYQSIHSIKSNAFALEQNTFGDKVHKIESKIKKLSEKEDVGFKDMLNLTKDIEKLTLQKENFKETKEKIKAHKLNETFEGENKMQNLLLNSLNQTVKRVSNDLRKNVKLVAGEIEIETINKNIRRIIKDILLQLIRNSIVHGIEKEGQIKLSIKINDDKVHIYMSDNGRGFEYKKIAEKALKLKLIKREDINNKEELIKTVFSPGFSTAEEEGIHGGRGIGLNMVLDRIRENKGTFKVETKQGKGTTFHIYFPVT